MFNLTSPITGGAQTGFTSPTYTLTQDVAPNIHGKQWAVTALGGTQAGVSVHSASAPFTICGFRNPNYRPLGMQNPITGRLAAVPLNKQKIVIQGWAPPLAGQPAAPNRATLELISSAGCDTASAAQLRAIISVLVGMLNANSAAIGDSYVTNLW